MTHVPLLLIQLVVILGTARVFAMLLRRFGQPPVIGEMLAGIALGPILFGQLAPEWQAALFAKASLPALDGLSQIGIILFMFIVGAELRLPGGARRELTAASLVSVLSALLPMLLGLAISPMLYPQFAPDGVAFWPFALFIATSMAITAFPVLARILRDHAVAQTAVGRLALTSAAIADVMAWIMLAFVVALISARDAWSGFAFTALGSVAILLFMFVVLRPLLARQLARHATDGAPGVGMLTLLLIGLFASAAVTDMLGLHAVFGAFLFGAALPRDNRLLATLVERIESVAVIVMLPVFFALAGLNTTPDAFAGAAGLSLLLILAAAVAGKVFGGAAGARIGGMSWRDAFAVGSLMNARGLMELIVLKVGLDIGVIGPEIFTMLMVMAILTTLMASPLLAVFTRGNDDARNLAGQSRIQRSQN